MKPRVLMVLTASMVCLVTIPGDSDNRATAGLFRGRHCRNEVVFEPTPERHIRPYTATGGQIRVIGVDGGIVTPNSPSSTVLASSDSKVRVEIDVTIDPGWTVAPILQVFSMPGGATAAPYYNAPTPNPMNGVYLMSGAGGSSSGTVTVTYSVTNVVVNTMNPGNFNNFMVIWVVSDKDSMFHHVHRLPPNDMTTVLGWKIRK